MSDPEIVQQRASSGPVFSQTCRFLHLYPGEPLMAIYSGDWRDEAGRPFDPQCYPRPSDKQGQIAQRRSYPGSRPQYTRGHYVALQWLAGQWNNVLSAYQRGLWNMIAAICVSNRDYATPDVWNGFVAYANRNWPVAYGMPGDYMQAPGWTEAYITSVWMMNAKASTQTMRIQIIFDKPPGFEKNMTVYFYHINPRYGGTYYSERMTRLGLAFKNFNAVDTLYELEIPMQWRQEIGEEAYVYIKSPYMYTWWTPFYVNNPVT